MKIKTCIKIIVIIILLLSGLSWNPAAAASILKVSPDGLTSGDCVTWENACDLQYALGIANSGDEVWASSGFYYPGDSRDDTFQLEGGVEIYGSVPWGAESKDERNIYLYPTILYGNIGEPGEYDNVYRVVTGINVSPTAVLDGFYIEDGYNDLTGVPNEWGGGIYLQDSNVILSNLYISGNSARGGGGLFISGSPSTVLVLNRVMFYGNHAFVNGGGMHTYHAGFLELNNVAYVGNYAAKDGGGMYNLYSNPTMTNIEFTDNLAAQNGGGMYNYDHSSPMVTNASLWSNDASIGGGIYNDTWCSPTLTNVTISANSALDGTALYNSTSSTSTLVNAILWNNNYPQIGGDLATTSYSDIQGGYDGLGDEIGNIDLDPLLGEFGESVDLTRYAPLLSSSPAIDTGSPEICPELDQRGMDRPQDGDGDMIYRCDMGAYEYLLKFMFIPIVQR